MDHLAVGVRQHLDLDVARTGHGLLQEHRRVAEGRLGLPYRRLDRRSELVGGLDAPQPPPPTARRRLHEQGEPDFAGRADQVVHRRSGPDATQHRDPGGGGYLFGPDLAPGEGQDLGRGADESDPGLVAGPGQGRVLGQEAVARVDGVGVAVLGRLDDAGDVQVGP